MRHIVTEPSPFHHDAAAGPMYRMISVPLDNHVRVSPIQFAEGRATPLDGSPREPGTLRDAQVKFEPSMYVAVLVAAFGGVRIELGPRRFAKLHPVLLLLLCGPLAVVQWSAIFALRTDLSLDKPWKDESTESGRQMLRLKILMIGIVYITNFRMLLNGLQLLLFFLNPMTWVEAYLPRHEDWAGRANAGQWWSRICFSCWWMFLCPVIGLFMHILMAWTVCTDSMSVIMSTKRAMDTIFNGLAITFIADLGKVWWDFVASMLHIAPLDDFKFRLHPEDKIWVTEGECAGDLTPTTQRSLACPEVATWLVRWTRSHWCAVLFGKYRSFLSRGNGARRLETAASLVALYWVFKRALLQFLLAYDTNILPAARDVCQYWRVHYGVGARNMLEYMPTVFTWVWENMMVISAKDTLMLSVDQKLQGNCTQAKMERLGILAAEVEAKYSTTMRIFTVIMLCFVVGPSIHFLFYKWITKNLGSITAVDDTLDDIDQEQEGEIDELEKQAKRHEQRLTSLEQKLTDVVESQERCRSARWFG